MPVLYKMKKKTWVVKLEAEITNFVEDNEDQLENKSHIISYVDDALNFENLGYTLGEFETKVKKISVKLRK